MRMGCAKSLLPHNGGQSLGAYVKIDEMIHIVLTMHRVKSHRLCTTKKATIIDKQAYREYKQLVYLMCVI